MEKYVEQPVQTGKHGRREEAQVSGLLNQAPPLGFFNMGH